MAVGMPKIMQIQYRLVIVHIKIEGKGNPLVGSRSAGLTTSETGDFSWDFHTTVSRVYREWYKTSPVSILQSEMPS